MSEKLEKVEQAALASIYAAASADCRSQLGLAEFTTGGAFVGIAGALPSSAIVANRTIGLGLQSPVSQEQISEIAEAYKDAEVSRYFIHVHPAIRSDELVDWLKQAGLAKTRGWMKFERGTGPVPEVQTELRVERIGSEHGRDFARIAAAAFDLGDAAEPLLERLPDRPGWNVFMSFLNDSPVGVGALFIEGETAWSDWGATSPEFRQRGSQSALLAHRISFAIEQGCTEIGTCTGEDVPGDPQHSYRNILKMGFKEAYVRENYALPKQSG